MRFADARAKPIVVRHVQQIRSQEQRSGVLEMRVRVDEPGRDEPAIQILDPRPRPRHPCDVRSRAHGNHAPVMYRERLRPGSGAVAGPNAGVHEELHPVARLGAEWHRHSGGYEQCRDGGTSPAHHPTSRALGNAGTTRSQKPASSFA